MGKTSYTDKPVIEIPGTHFGFRWEALCWTLYTRREVEHKNAPNTVEWCDPVYPVDFTHLAQIVCRDCGKDSPDVQSLVLAIVVERQRLEQVLAEIVQRTAETAGVAVKGESRWLVGQKA